MVFIRRTNLLHRFRRSLHHFCPSPFTKLSKVRYVKQRGKKDGTVSGGKDPSPPPSDLVKGNVPSSPSNEDLSSPSSSSKLIYLRPEYGVFTRSLAECNIHELIRQPKGVEKNEWIANNIVAFFNHVNALYNVMQDLCTPSQCPLMTGPQNSVYYWIDERNKKIKCSAPQYIELSLVYIQKILSDENIFPTKLNQQFPLYFDSVVRKIVRLLFHAVAHFYAVHYGQLIDFQLHPHLNSFFLHFLSFLITSNIISSDHSSLSMSTTTTTTTNSSNGNSFPSGSTNSINFSGSTDPREFRTELESLDVLYQFLAEQWRHSYAQASAQKRKAAQHE